MKRIRYILNSLIVAVCLSFLATSCNDLLETKVFSDIAPENFFKTESDMKAAVTGLYVPLTTNWGYGDGGTGGWYSALYCADVGACFPAGLLTTDELRSYNTSHDFVDFNFGSSTGGAINNTYNIIRFVARATDVINRIEQSGGATEDIRNRFIAETKTLRAFYMYTLLDWFGPVNVKLDPETLMDNTIEPRPSLSDYVGYIEKDLDDAIATISFPDKYNNDAANWGRMSKAIAYAIRMKVSMHERNWTEAKAACNQLMSMGYNLLPNYEDVFNLKRTVEDIYFIPSNLAFDNFYITEILPGNFVSGYNNKGEFYMRGNESSYLGGWQVYCMNWDFYDTFDDNDVRKKAILCKYVTANGETIDRTNSMVGAIPIKFTDSQYALFGIQADHPVIRYAEVLLSYAEAENEINGPTSDAIAAVKRITSRAGTEMPAGATANKDAFRSFLLAERGRELFCEGQRRQDLIRQGEFIKSAIARGKNAKEYQVLFPIPQFAITEAGGILKQNPGYTD